MRIFVHTTLFLQLQLTLLHRLQRLDGFKLSLHWQATSSHGVGSHSASGGNIHGGKIKTGISEAESINAQVVRICRRLILYPGELDPRFHRAPSDLASPSLPLSHLLRHGRSSRDLPSLAHHASVRQRAPPLGPAPGVLRHRGALGLRQCPALRLHSCVPDFECYT